MNSSPTSGSSPEPSQARRPIKMRAARWVKALASVLARRSISPNLISLCSVVFALLGGGAIAATTSLDNAWSQSAAFVVAAICIQLRLLANMIDGMVAVEGGLGGVLGDIYNEFPDRFADAFFIIPAGYVALSAPWPWGDVLGWTACSLALLTAYVRAMGASIGARHAFHGPMAKPHRMFLLTCACIAAAIGVRSQLSGQVMYIALVLMVAGMVVTLVRRLRCIAADLRKAEG